MSSFSCLCHGPRFECIAVLYLRERTYGKQRNTYLKCNCVARSRNCSVVCRRALSLSHCCARQRISENPIVANAKEIFIILNILVRLRRAHTDTHIVIVRLYILHATRQRPWRLCACVRPNENRKIWNEARTRHGKCISMVNALLLMSRCRQHRGDDEDDDGVASR